MSPTTARCLLFSMLLPFASLPLCGQSVAITGKVVEAVQNTPVEFATVLLTSLDNDASLGGTTTGPDGSFALEAPHSRVRIQITFIGFAPRTLANFEQEGGTIDLGVVQLAQDQQTLEEVVVRAEKSQTVFKLDKRVFNVGKDLSSTGASALEILNNVPSVNVNIEGEIALRGSTGVQILINGKPSVLASEQGNALGTLTADMIERIEVITNPSAKYDAEGTSGIINIVLKKEERDGINGSVTLNTGWPHNHSLGLSLNRRTEKFNLFSQLGAGYRELPNDVRSTNQDLRSGNSLLSEGEEFRNENFYNFILGADYHINEANVLTLSGNFAYEIEDQPSATAFEFRDAAGQLLSAWERTESTQATNPKWQYELQYKKDFEDDEEHMLLFSALGSFFGKSQSSVFDNNTTVGDTSYASQQTRTDFKEAEYTFKLDYTRPVSEQFTIETGAQYVATDVSNDFAVSNLQDGLWANDPNFTNVFEYGQQVLGLYGTGGYEGGKWGLKVGLRLESTILNTLLATTQTANEQRFLNLFPSAHTSFKVTPALSFQAGYSRRVFRPRLWDLNPFFNIRNNFSIRTGNPELQPEFTDSYEVSAIYLLGQASLNFSLYHRYTTDVVERVATVADNVQTTTPQNIGTNQSTGLEANFKYSPKAWLSLNGDLNYNYFSRKGQLEGTSFNFDADQWSAKVTAKLKGPANIDFEITGHYRSSFQTVQSIVEDQVFADMGLRKKVLNGRGVINLSVRDLFASRVQESTAEQATFNLYNRRFRGRFITLGFSYGFGKGEAMEFSGQKRF
ncbi:outer membrane beta-barrel family protein [Phaeodactylibacter luteus]|nr:outer membrane beta-barrel family protein [Phaeodactylibacter luteus]